jgi:hypothetical protein
MRTNRWIFAAAFGLAVAACSTTKDSQTASADEAREEQVAAAGASGTGTGVAAGTDTGATASGEPSASATGRTGAGGMDASATASGTAAAPREVIGRVALVDKEAREIAIDSGDATTQVKLSEDAQILINGEKGDLDDVKQGQEVRASLDQLPEGPAATRVEVTSKAKE